MEPTSQVGDLPPQRVTHVRCSRARHGLQRTSGVLRFQQCCSESLRLWRYDYPPAISNVGEYCTGVARLSHEVPHTSDDRTRRRRHCPPASLPFPPSRICLESIVRTSNLGGCCLNLSSETISNRTGNVAQAHVCW